MLFNADLDIKYVFIAHTLAFDSLEIYQKNKQYIVFNSNIRNVYVLRDLIKAHENLIIFKSLCAIEIC